VGAGKGIKYRNIQYRQPFRHPALRRGGVAEKLSAKRSNVKNITVTVDDETYRRARIKAAERDTSVSALIRCFLAGRESNAEGLKREERASRERIGTFRAACAARRRRHRALSPGLQEFYV
jgi:hypothetical protein